MRTAKRILAVLAVLTWIAAPLVIAGVVTARSERAVQAAPPASTWVAAGPVATEISRALSARAELQEQPPVLAPAWTGLVEEVGIQSGVLLRSGDQVAVIDGVPRLAAATGRPLRRPLGPGDRGNDVADLNRWLVATGYEATDGDRFGSATRRGVLSLRRDLGVGDPPATDTPVDAEAAARARGFDPAWLVFLAREEVTVGSTILQAGAPAPPAGSVIAEVAPQVVSVSLVLADQTGIDLTGDAPAAPTTPSPGTSAPSGDPAPGSAPPVSTGTPLRQAAEGATLRQGDTPLGSIDPDGSLPPATERVVIGLLGTNSTISLQLVEPAPAGARTVVANAVFTGPTGATCVASRTSQTARTTVHLVVPLGGTTRQPLVLGAPEGEIEVLVNPTVDLRRRCRT